MIRLHEYRLQGMGIAAHALRHMVQLRIQVAARQLAEGRRRHAVSVSSGSS